MEFIPLLESQMDRFDLDGADDNTRDLAAALAARNDLLTVGIYDPYCGSFVNCFQTEPINWAEYRITILFN